LRTRPKVIHLHKENSSDEVSKQSTPESQRSQDEVSQRMAEIASILGGNGQSDRGTLPGARTSKSEQEKLSRDVNLRGSKKNSTIRNLVEIGEPGEAVYRTLSEASEFDRANSRAPQENEPASWNKQRFLEQIEK